MSLRRKYERIVRTLGSSGVPGAAIAARLGVAGYRQPGSARRGTEREPASGRNPRGVSAVATPPARSRNPAMCGSPGVMRGGISDGGGVNPRGAPWGILAITAPGTTGAIGTIGTIFGATGRAGLSLGRLRDAECPASICWLSSRRRFATSIADSATCPIAATRRSSPRRRSRGCSRSCSKPGGRIYQQTFVDPYAKLGFAKLYDRKTPLTAADLLTDRPIVKTPLPECDPPHTIPW